jgi:hypothetical protein
MLLFMEGFDWSTTTADYITYGKWGDRSACTLANNSTVLRFGASSGNYLTVGTSVGDFFRRPIGQNLASGIVGFAYRQSTSGSSLYRRNIVVFFDTTANVQFALIQNNDLTMSIIRTSWANVLGTTTYTIPVDTWVFIELKWKVSDSISSGDVELRVNGTTVLTLAAASDTKNTANAYATHYAFNGNSPTVTTSTANTGAFWDDHYLFDLTGSTNNNFVGNVRVQTLFPSGDGNYSQFVGSDGNSTNNSLLVDDTSVNSADYVDGANVGDKDTYAYGNTVTTTSIIYGLALNHIALRTDATARSMQPVIRTGGSDYNGSDIVLAMQVVPTIRPSTKLIRPPAPGGHNRM